MPSAITRLILLDEVASTSSYLAARADTLPHGAVVAARSQTAGRGQRGNSWEAEPGKNLTFSLMLRPEAIAAANQFALSEAVAVAIATTLQEWLPEAELRIKWPNDVYANNRKICGILIENSLIGNKIRHSIAGIGINVNQTIWTSDAPNPVSMAQIAGHDFPLDRLLERLCAAILHELQLAQEALTTSAAAAGTAASGSLHDRYMSLLWGRSALTYRDTATGEIFRAAIASIAPDGMLTLAPLDGSAARTYAFKQVAVLL